MTQSLPLPDPGGASAAELRQISPALTSPNILIQVGLGMTLKEMAGSAEGADGRASEARQGGAAQRTLCLQLLP